MIDTMFAFKFMVFWSAIGWAAMFVSAVVLHKGYGTEEETKAYNEVREELSAMGPGLAMIVLVLLSFCWPALFIPKGPK